ncbi:MAG TPA: anaerobic glycerol-3-phosphate dehydrogenase subunit GlpA [Anaerolineales bacterium]|nr:anaerobic glycerol-3-phosphate dehydrogenase subunit GlpA [Anaerolineales bacterium]
MSSLTTEILVIGGGSTGAGIARDAALRGFKTILLDRGDLATGTTGRYHGLLHSGGRYVVKDPISAKECIDENYVLRRIAADCIEDTGGLFVETEHDDPNYAAEFVAGCQRAGIPIQELSPGEALRREPRLNPRLSRVFWVPDATIDAWKTVWANARDVQAHAGTVLSHHKITQLIRDGDVIRGAVAVNARTGEAVTIHADYTINASGAWAGQIAGLAGLPVTVLSGKGIMIAMNHRLTQMVVNRLKRPADGDILVPIRTVCVIGTTDVRVADPDDWPIEEREIQFMLDEGEKLVPGFRDARALRVWGGVRPLYQPPSLGAVSDTRDVSRTYTLLDHADADGLTGFLTMTGGKFTTYRQMAEVAVDAACRHLGVERACSTASTALPDSEEGRFYWLGARLHRREQDPHGDQLVCECEMITRARITDAMRARGGDLDDIRRTVRLGMGPCQGGFCIYRAAGLGHANGISDAEATNTHLLRFVTERWKGVQPLLWGDQLRQAVLDDQIFQGLLDIEHLPGWDRAESGERGAKGEGLTQQAEQSSTAEPPAKAKRKTGKRKTASGGEA